MNFDFHMHSKYSFDSILEPKKIIKVAKKKGLDGVAITDHNTIKGSLEAKKINNNPNFLVITGSEINTEIGDITGLFLNEEIKSRSSMEVIDKIHEQGGIVVLPHPYRGHEVDELRKILDRIELIEVFNARNNELQNRKADELATSYEMHTIAGSDAHFSSEIGLGRTIIKTECDIKDVRVKMLKGDVAIVGVYSPAYLQPLSQMIRAVKTKNYKNMVFQLYNLINSFREKGDST
ncbi:Error-prone DNA polymerase [ANME-1 cluster archaeon GoMg2]|nr:Error-prone DNA polymerase [ANME-1 cluster archaeon GoMg2]